MAHIRVLPDEVARQIAAGEVVERPASVIKELIENAVDAGAKLIRVRTVAAGVNLIEVEDNGVGMSPEDVPLAMRSFATSKIKSADDLLDVDTYGFRGEALASISAVARLEVVSSETTTGEGWRYTLEGKEVLANEPAPHERGTTVRVERLFFNTPARKKFLKSEVTEKRRILETILSFALVYPEIEFQYVADDKSALSLVPTHEWRERVAAILGNSTMTHMVPIEASSGRVNVTGFTSLPTYTRANRNQQFLYVNGRPVREKTVVQAVQSAYRSVIPYKRFAAAIVKLEVPPTDVDVNVHPNKLEVRLREERRVFDAVQRAIRQALTSQAESTLEVSYSTERKAGNGSAVSIDSHSDTPQLSFAKPAQTAGDHIARVENAYGSYMDRSAKVMEFNPQLSLKTGADVEEAAPDEDLHESVKSDDALFWQFDNSYIFIQVRGGIVVIDQHAAHERIIFDSSKARLESEIPISQQILFPIHLELTITELEIFRTSKDVFHKLGFHLEPFGGTSVLVRGYPQGIKNWQDGLLLRNIFDDINEGRRPGNTHSDQIVASFACHSAVKAGDKLSMEEMKMLADQLFALPNPYSCPHGRPTIQRISLEEVESWFHRR